MKITATKFLAILLCAASTAWADPVIVNTVPCPLQDNWLIEGEVEELSTAPWNPPMEQITAAVVPWEGHIPCPADYQGLRPNVQVAITNMTQRSFTSLYYVGDVGSDGIFQTTFTNLDEYVADMTPTGNHPVPGMAFRIDKRGSNTPLVFESMNQDEVFEPGETWQFVIQEYNNSNGFSPAALGSVSPIAPFGAIAQASGGIGTSSGSIITPEPATLLLLGAGAVAMLRQRKHE